MIDRRHVALGATLVATCLSASSPAAAREFMKEEEALRRVFSDSVTVERRVVVLTALELARVNELAGEGEAMRDSLIVCFTGTRAAEAAGTVYFDTHRVRTLDEEVMFFITPDDRIADVLILRFDEPPDYRASDRWLRRLKGRSLDRGLSLKGSVHGITGATLTARAITRAARRTLAVHAVLRDRGDLNP